MNKASDFKLIADKAKKSLEEQEEYKAQKKYNELLDQVDFAARNGKYSIMADHLTNRVVEMLRGEGFKVKAGYGYEISWS